MVDESEMNLIDKAHAAAQRLEIANAKQEELVKRMEAIESRNILGGQTLAGQPANEKKEETAAEYAKRMLRGGV